MDGSNRTTYLIIADAGRVSEEYCFVFVFVIACCLLDLKFEFEVLGSVFARGRLRLAERETEKDGPKRNATENQYLS